MNREVLYEAMTNISDRFIEEADPEAGSGYMPRIRRLRPILNTAAVLIVVLGLTTAAVRSGLLSGAKAEAPAAEAPAEAAPMIAQYSLTMESAYDEAMPEAEESEVDTPAEMFAESAPVPEPAAGESPAGQFAEEADGIETEEMLDRLIRGGISEDDAETLVSYPLEILWNGVPYQLREELLSELPEFAVSSGVIENTGDAVFFAPAEKVLGMQVFVSADGDFLYLSLGDLWVAYAKV